VAAPGRPPRPLPPIDTPLFRAVQAELEAAGRVDLWLGRAALMLALRLGDPACPSSAVARLSKELQATMAAALKDVVIVDPLDELRVRRDRKGVHRQG
jgi:hypothetical protein